MLTYALDYSEGLMDDSQIGQKARQVEPVVGNVALERTATNSRRALGVGAVAIGAFALGAAAIGALAIGSVAIGALALKRGRIHRLRVDHLEVRRLHVGELTRDR